ncbi:MAG TPA: KUP/HAK/KT family potassium transporter, partial [Candidatus Acidoferrum sp.]|nr:KUP/HAK/KT family potassium transporter [Candidatus Acidoferrum sp.]
LGYLPRLRVLHTSEQEIGQVYVPKINTGLFVAIVVLVIGFQSSDSLGAAYGIAVTGMMVITSGLAFIYMRSIGWSFSLAAIVFGFFLTVDLIFLSANLLKIMQGGWFPILVAAVVFAIMSTWWRGRQVLAEKRASETMPLESFVATLKPDHPSRVAGTAVIMARDTDQVPTALLHALKHYKVLHKRVVLLNVLTRDVPHIGDDERLELRDLGNGIYTLRLSYGFMDEPNILRALAQCRIQRFHFNLLETSFIIGREKLVLARDHRFLSRWRKRLFILTSNTALDATEFFRIPLNRVVELGGQVEV